MLIVIICSIFWVINSLINDEFSWEEPRVMLTESGPSVLQALLVINDNSNKPKWLLYHSVMHLWNCIWKPSEPSFILIKEAQQVSTLSYDILTQIMTCILYGSIIRLYMIIICMFLIFRSSKLCICLWRYSRDEHNVTLLYCRINNVQL